MDFDTKNNTIKNKKRESGSGEKIKYMHDFLLWGSPVLCTFKKSKSNTTPKHSTQKTQKQ